VAATKAVLSLLAIFGGSLGIPLWLDVAGRAMPAHR
jgi:hypothetical protein